jgi:competence protein ComEA
MLWLYRLQQRLSITPAEGTALLVASGALVAGLAVRQIQASAAPPAAALLVEDDRIAAIDAAAARPDAPAAPTGSYLDPAPEANARATGVTPAPIRRPPRARSTAGPPAPHSISINAAPARELERLPRIGPALATRIVEHRTARGSFTSIEQLEDVRGIGPRMLEQIRPYVTL